MANLKKGSTGPAVEDLQRQLNRLGYDPGVIDGDFGPKTRAAVRAFQKRSGVEVDGIVGPETRRALRKAIAAFVKEPPKENGRTVSAGSGSDGRGVAVTGGGGNRTNGGAVTTPPATVLDIDRSLRLNAGQYYDARHPKDLIVLHHTAGGSARSTLAWWNSNATRIATAYIIERDGTIHEVFDPRGWAFHLGIKGTNGAVDRRSIGIEIACEGGLKESEGKLYTFDRIAKSSEYAGSPYRHTAPWRGYRCYAPYTPAQITAAVRLTDHLLDEFNIPRRTPADHLSYDKKLLNYKGVVGHHHLRADKSDVHPGFDWERLVEKCGLKN